MVEIPNSEKDRDKVTLFGLSSVTSACRKICSGLEAPVRKTFVYGMTANATSYRCYIFNKFLCLQALYSCSGSTAKRGITYTSVDRIPVLV